MPPVLSECNREAGRDGGVLSALSYIRHDEYRGSINHHWIFSGYLEPPAMGQRADPGLAGIPICSFHIMIAMLIRRSLTVRTTPGRTESGWRSISASTSNTSRSARATVIS